MPTTTLPPGQHQAATSTFTRLRLPHATLFAERVHRCQTLAQALPFADRLKFCAVLARQQDLEFQRFPTLPLPDSDFLQHCQRYEVPPLSPAAWPPHPHWQELVHRLIRAATPALSLEVQQALQRCPTTDPSWLDIQKNHLFSGNTQLISGVIIPFISGALQVQWSSLAARLSPASLQHPTPKSRCPVCGSLPLVATLNPKGAKLNQRVLHCSLCSSSWLMDKYQCSNCGSDKKLAIQESTTQPHVQAEVCHLCMSYLKRITMQQTAEAEPVADDLASLELDQAMAAKDLRKAGVNFLFLSESFSRDSSSACCLS
ncbi:formate dehydrogenase accessory protein FdhE [Desulfobulbus rhabdoformis]|uniref:formate dehydrogenase accessory protein FdhE n=1 Tax=Desulfobulbus rhabdoformis TaxID=34032 RepID=UPI00196302A3|nr:formate dehydrogenase accessory protein FdhE [Desulfobulbus rhabdoformis]MBM9615863.1 formate dehydrogenase accessory protein FdhE [Desulfobulbus rhabdoformis]